MTEEKDDLIDILHASIITTSDRGTVVTASRVKEADGKPGDLILWVIEDVEKAKEIFNEKPDGEPINIKAEPDKFGLRPIYLSQLPEPQKTEWTEELQVYTLGIELPK